MYASTHADVSVLPDWRKAELAKLYKAIDAFTEEMVRALERKVDAGWRGWDDPANGKDIYNAMLAHGSAVNLAFNQEVAIANFAMFLWYHRTGGNRMAMMPMDFVAEMERAQEQGIHPCLPPPSERTRMRRFEMTMDSARVQRMVDRFLAWPLPKTFSPDAGIHFDGAGIEPEAYRDSAGHRRFWPTGTNLFTAIEAREMVEFMLSGEDRPGC